MALDDDLLQQRAARIAELQKLGFRPYGQAFEFTHTIPQILAGYGSKSAQELEPPVRVRIAGRILTMRRMGKAGFAHLQQNGERLQIYIKKDAVSERDYQLYLANRLLMGLCESEHDEKAMISKLKTECGY